MNFLKQNKTGIGVVLVLVLGVWAYFTYFGGSGAPPLSGTAETPSPVASQLLTTLGSLHTIKLDSSLFSDPVFVSLSDFGVVIPTQEVGRRNPFAPLGK